MAICEWCGKEFDLQDAEDEFESGTFKLAYSNVRKCLCGSCSVEAIEDEVDGVYFETCEECGKEFDLAEESGEFDSNFSWENGTSLRDYWDEKILCCDCALKVAEQDEF